MSATMLSAPMPFPLSCGADCGHIVLPVAASYTPSPTTTCADLLSGSSRAMAGPPHQSEAPGSPVAGLPRFAQRNSPFSSKAMSPPCEWPTFSSGFQPPVTKQTCPSPLQSPAAMDETAFTT